MAKAKIKTREEWLLQAMSALTELFTEFGHKVPKKLRASCGFPSKAAFAAKSQRIGECWSDSASKGKWFEIFISPVLKESSRVLDVLAHEMVHAVVGLKCGHRGQFKRVAIEIGLHGPMRATFAGPELKKRLDALAKALGAYPHDELNKCSVTNAKKKQVGRMLKVVCPECGYLARITTQWIEIGCPTCPCGEEMLLDTTPKKRGKR